MTPTSKKSTDEKTDEKATKNTAEAQLADVRTESASAEPMNLNANQQPTTVAGKNFDQSLIVPTKKVQPVAGVDGMDGSHLSASSKATDNVWTPFVPPAWFQPSVSIPMQIWLNGAWTAAAYNATASTTNDTADLAANSLTKF